jgi:hypothetical protein
MALVFMDGFDKYGPLSTAPTPYLNQEWNTISGTTFAIAAGLSSSGSAVNIGSASTMTRNLGANYSRLIGGFRFSTGLTNNGVLTFYDGGSAQASIVINVTTGTIGIRNGAVGGTLLGTSAASVTANSTHYLEYDITFANAGSYQLWLDGVSILSGTGDTTTTANSFANAILLGQPNVAANTFLVDDFYLFDATGTVNNAPLLTSPRIETQFPNADASVQFAIGAAVLGPINRGLASAALGFTSVLWLRAVTASRACTLNSISFTPLYSNASANFRTCVYADNAGAPGALIASGTTITGAVNGTTITGSLTAPPSLTAGVQYWIGIITDTGSSNPGSSDSAGTGRFVTITFASGPPSTAPAMSVSPQTPLFWGNITGTGANWYEVSQNPVAGNLSYVFDATVGHEDLYSFPAMSTPPTTIHGVAVRANVAKSDSGTKTVSVRSKSGATDSAGSVASFAPGTTYGWLTSLFPTDPATGAAWTLSALNAAQAGLKIET